MKRIITLLFACFIGLYAQAQVPQAISYQAVARNAAGAALVNQTISIRITIKDNSSGGPTIYSETHTGVSTNQFGLFTIEVGNGNPVTGTFTSINWGTNTKFMKVEMDPAGGSSYIDMGTSQMLSVPFALYAGAVAGGGAGDNWGTQSAATNSTLTGNGTSGSPLGIAQQGATNSQVLQWNGTAWAPATITGGVGDNWGTQSVVTNSTLTGTGVTGNSLGLAQQGATNGQVLKWNGASWAPASDLDNDAQTLSINGSNLSISNGNTVVLPTGTTYTQGTGISIAGNVISNTGDLSTSNELQTLSISGNTLTISSGNSVILPTGTTYTQGTGISLAGNVITNTAPDQVVTLTGTGSTTVTGTYPNFTINSTGGGGSYTGGTGITISGSVINSVWTASGNNIYNNNTANVGINNAAPTYKLDVNSTNTAAAIYGKYSGTTTGNKAIWGSNQNSTSLGQGNIGVYGDYNAAAYGAGVVGIGFQGITTLPVSNDIGVYGSAANVGIYGNATTGTAVYGASTYIPVYGFNSSATGVTIANLYDFGNPAGYFFSQAGQGSYSVSSGENTFGVNSVSNGAVNIGNSLTATYNIGTLSYALGGSYPTTVAVNGIESYAEADATNFPDYVQAIAGVPMSNGFVATNAGYFAGDVDVVGFLTKGGGTFKIDHPLDPLNKFLYHSFVESPDMMNIYNGNITTDANGEAVITLPDYFFALNKDFRYQLTAIGQFANVIVLEEISANNQFKIKSSIPNVKVSWQVTGIRQDAYANAHRVVPEVNKQGKEKGRYLYPELYGQTMDQGIGALHFSNGLKKSPTLKLKTVPVSTGTFKKG